MAAPSARSDIGLSRAASYGVGDLGFNLFYTGLNLYLLFYYTDVVQIQPAVAGLIFMIPALWDAVVDPAMGFIASRTRSRFGVYRPYLLFGGPVLGLSYSLMFAAPILWPQAPVIACLFSHILFRTAYTVVNVPYASLSAAITHDSHERSLLAAARMQFAALGGVATAFLTPWLAGKIGNGDLVRGYLWTAVLYAGIATGLFALTYAGTSESPEAQKPDRMPLSKTLHFLGSNRPFWVLAVAIAFAIFGISMSNKAIVYYVSYYIGQPDAVRYVLTLSTLMIALSVVFWTRFEGYSSKRKVWMLAGSLSILLQLALFVTAPNHLPLVIGFALLNGFCTGGVVVMMWSMLPDTVEYGEWRSGARDESILFGLNNLIQKGSSALGAGLVGVILGAIGYMPNEPQSPQTLKGLLILCSAAPAASAVLAVSVIRFYPLNASRHSEIVDDLAKREL
ncbi:MAG: MFS transporter [Parvularcula sp.]